MNDNGLTFFEAADDLDVGTIVTAQLHRAVLYPLLPDEDGHTRPAGTDGERRRGNHYGIDFPNEVEPHLQIHARTKRILRIVQLHLGEYHPALPFHWNLRRTLLRLKGSLASL